MILNIFHFRTSTRDMQNKSYQEPNKKINLTRAKIFVQLNITKNEDNALDKEMLQVELDMYATGVEVRRISRVKCHAMHMTDHIRPG